MAGILPTVPVSMQLGESSCRTQNGKDFYPYGAFAKFQQLLGTDERMQITRPTDGECW